MRKMIVVVHRERCSGAGMGHQGVNRGAGKDERGWTRRYDGGEKAIRIEMTSEQVDVRKQRRVSARNEECSAGNEQRTSGTGEKE